MKNICFRISDEEHDFFETKVKEHFKISLPRFFKIVGINALNKDSDIKNTKADLVDDLGLESSYKDNFVAFKVHDELYHALKESAEKHGWSLSKEMRFRLKHTMSNDLDFYDQELKVLLKNQHEVKRIGRNVNMILRRDEGRVLDKDGFRQDITGLIQRLDDMEKLLGQYIKKCRGRMLSQHISVKNYEL